MTEITSVPKAQVSTQTTTATPANPVRIPSQGETAVEAGEKDPATNRHPARRRWWMHQSVYTRVYEAGAKLFLEVGPGCATTYFKLDPSSPKIPCVRVLPAQFRRTAAAAYKGKSGKANWTRFVNRFLAPVLSAHKVQRHSYSPSDTNQDRFEAFTWTLLVEKAKRSILDLKGKGEGKSKK